MNRLRLWGLLLAAALALGACDQQAVEALEEGVSTEADVLARFGTPERVWGEADGSRTLEYNRQPQGVRNYMITIGPDGYMSALRQVLTPQNFARIQPGMGRDDVWRTLGKPATQVPYQLKQEVVWTWKFLEPPNQTMAFHVVFNMRGQVLRTEVGPDPDSIDMRGGR